MNNQPDSKLRIACKLFSEGLDYNNFDKQEAIDILSLTPEPNYCIQFLENNFEETKHLMRGWKRTY